MSAIEKINQLVLDQIDYTDDQLESLDEAKTIAFGALHEAALTFEALGGDISKSESLIELAGVFGAFAKQLTPDQVDKVEAAVANIFGAPTPDQQASGVAIFNTAVDAISATQAVNEYVDGLLAPSDEG